MIRSEAAVSGSARRKATSAMERAALRNSWAREIMMANEKNNITGRMMKIATPMAPGMADRSASERICQISGP